MTNGFQKPSYEQVGRGGPTPLPKADDANSYQSRNTEERLQRLSLSKGRQTKNQKTYEHHTESMDEATSPLINRLDSQNSFRNHKQAQSKIL